MNVTQETAEEIDLSKLGSIIQKYNIERGGLIAVLQKTQEVYGYLPETALALISTNMNISLSEVFGVATFFAQFRFEPLGENLIKVCHGTACHVIGAERISFALEDELNVETGGTTSDRKFTLDNVACLGCCSIAPCMMINDVTYGRLTPDKTRKVVRKLGK